MKVGPGVGVNNSREVDPMRHPNYWKAYHASKIYDKREVFKVCLRVSSKLGPPWQISKRGRPPTIHPTMHAAICIFRKCFGSSFRGAASDMSSLGVRVDHVTIWWALWRIPLSYFERALGLLYELIAELFKCVLFITDSTGIETDRYRKRRRGLKNVKEHEFLKLHMLAGYSREAGLTPILSARVTRGEAHDSPQFEKLLKNFQGRGEPLLGDSAYDAGKNFELARKHGLRPLIKLRDIEPKGLLRRQAAHDFEQNRELYRMRGVGEAPFGGFAIRYNSQTRCRLAHMRRADSLLMAVAHDVRTYMRARAMKKLQIFYLTWFKGELLNNLTLTEKLNKPGHQINHASQGVYSDVLHEMVSNIAKTTKGYEAIKTPSLGSDKRWG